MKHGAYSKMVLLPSERARDWNDLKKRLWLEWAPDGPTEELFVDQLAALMWQRERIVRYENALLQQRVNKVRSDNEANNYRRELHDLGPKFAQAQTFASVEKLLRKYAHFKEIIKTWAPRPREEDEAKWGPTISKHLEKVEVGPIVEGPSEAMLLIDPSMIEVQFKRLDRIEERISQVSKKLMQIKTAKQLFPNRHVHLSKVINVQPSAKPTEVLFLKEGGDRAKSVTAAPSSAASGDVVRNIR